MSDSHIFQFLPAADFQVVSDHYYKGGCVEYNSRSSMYPTVFFNRKIFSIFFPPLLFNNIYNFFLLLHVAGERE